MNKKKLFGERKIKCIGDCTNNEWSLHPVSLYLTKNVGKTCPTEAYDKNNIVKHDKICSKKDKISVEQMKSFMALPYINLSINEIIKIYNVESIDDLINWFESNIDKNISFSFINRILNIWIKINYQVVKDFNNIFDDFYFKILKKFFPKINVTKNQIGSFIKDWLKKKNIDDFIFDLGNEIKDYFQKK
jgi:hypothetical protein